MKLFLKISFICLLFLFLPTISNADMKWPSSTVYFYYNNQKLSYENIKVEELFCSNEPRYYYENDPLGIHRIIEPELKVNIFDKNKNCYWSANADNIMTEKNCHDNECRLDGLRGSKLAIYLSSNKKLYISEEVSTDIDDSYYNAELFSDGSMKLNEIKNFFVLNADQIKSFTVAFILTIPIEIIFAFIFLLITKSSKKILYSIILANIITVPIIW